MVEVEIPQSLLEEQGRQLYGSQLLQIQVIFYDYFCNELINYKLYNQKEKKKTSHINKSPNSSNYIHKPV